MFGTIYVTDKPHSVANAHIPRANLRAHRAGWKGFIAVALS